MAFLRNKKEEDEEDYDIEELEERSPSRKSFRDLKPENRKRRKEPVKPWGKKERVIVLLALLVTVISAAFLTISSTGFSLPKLSGISLPKLGSGTIVIEGTKEQREKADKIKQEFNQQTSSLLGSYGLYVVDLSNGFGFGVKETEVFPSASFNKLQVLAALYKGVEDGTVDLNATHTLVKTDKQGGSGTLFQEPEGTIISFTELARLVGNGPDNTALYIAEKEVGGEEEINKVSQEMGMENTSFSENQTTPKDIGIFLKNLWGGQTVSEKSRDQILDFLTNTIGEDLIPQGVPKGVRVSHKYGTIDLVINDAGIVFAQKPYVLVVMSKDTNPDQAQKAIPEISKTVYDLMVKP